MSGSGSAVGASSMTPGVALTPWTRIDSASGPFAGAGGRVVIRRCGDVEIRNRDSGLYQRSLAHSSRSNKLAGGPKPSHLTIGFNSGDHVASPTTQPRTERWLKSTRTRSPTPMFEVDAPSA